MPSYDAGCFIEYRRVALIKRNAFIAFPLPRNAVQHLIFEALYDTTNYILSHPHHQIQRGKDP